MCAKGEKFCPRCSVRKSQLSSVVGQNLRGPWPKDAQRACLAPLHHRGRGIKFGAVRERQPLQLVIAMPPQPELDLSATAFPFAGSRPCSRRMPTVCRRFRSTSQLPIDRRRHAVRRPAVLLIDMAREMNWIPATSQCIRRSAPHKNAADSIAVATRRPEAQPLKELAVHAP